MPPVDLCTGVSPSQAEKSRPHRKASAAGARATSAAAVTGPTPGMVSSRRAIGSSLARLAISASSTAISVSSVARVCASTLRLVRAASGSSLVGSSILAIRRST